MNRVLFVYTDVQLITMNALRHSLPSVAQTIAETVGLNPTGAWSIPMIPLCSCGPVLQWADSQWQGHH